LLTTHYRIYTTASRPEILSYLPGFMEAAHDNYVGLTGLAGPAAPSGGGKDARMPIYMMGTRQEWSALTRSIVGEQWNVYSSIQAGGYCYQGVCVFWDMGGVGSLSVASHEGMHQFLGQRLKDHLPMWLEEALAAMSEGYQIDGQSVRFTPDQNASRFNDLRKALVNDWWIGLDKLLPMDGGDAVRLGSPERTVGYYGQVWALGVFLRSDPAYAAGRTRMLADAAAGRFHQALKLPADNLTRLYRRGPAYNHVLSARLFRHYIAADLPAFERRYKDFARKLVRLE
jgi:hypothetical protein